MGGGTNAGGSIDPNPAMRVAPGTLGGGTDAVLLARVEPTGALLLDVVNDAARTLFGLDDSNVRLVVETAPQGVRALLDRVRAGAQRDRATREQVALVGPDGARVVVDVQLEPLPPSDTARDATRCPCGDPARREPDRTIVGTAGSRRVPYRARSRRGVHR